MPEIKHNFTGGKMNKDLDERIVPNGEYRDAMNIQVSTSEGSDVGTVQNVLGNSMSPGQGFIPSNAKCVGSVADEKNDKLYWFMIGNVPDFNSIVNGDFEDTTTTTYTTWSNAVVNKQEWTLVADNSPSAQQHGMAITGGLLTRDNTNNSSNSSARQLFDVVEGVEYVMSYDRKYTGGTSTQTNWYMDWGDGDQELGKSTENSGEWVTVVDSFVASFTGTMQIRIYFIGDMEGEIDNITITSPTQTSRIIEYNSKTNTVTPVIVDINNAALKLNLDNLITGINVIDDMLFWTDNNSEPKKINIPRSIQGTSSNGIIHTDFINEKTDSSYRLKEEHITVIKKQPILAPKINLVEERDPTKTYSGVMRITSQPTPMTLPRGEYNDGSNSITNEQNTSSMWIDADSWTNHHYDFSGLSRNDNFDTWIETDLNGNSGFTLDWAPGDIIVFKAFEGENYDEVPAVPLTDYTVKAKILNSNVNNFSDGVTRINSNGDFINITTNGTKPADWSFSNFSTGWEYDSANNKVIAVDEETNGASQAQYKKLYITPTTPTYDSSKPPLLYKLRIGTSNYTTYQDSLSTPVPGDRGAWWCALIVPATLFDGGANVDHSYRFGFTSYIQDDGEYEVDFLLEPESGVLNASNLWTNYHNKLMFQARGGGSKDCLEMDIDYIYLDKMEEYNASNQPTSTSAKIRCKILGIDGVPEIVPEGRNEIRYAVDKFDTDDKIFEFKFPRIAYRYKYQDGEYSAISPFSQVAFLPGSFDYHPRKGFNAGMSNRIKEIEVGNFMQNIPDGVTEVDILYKEDTAPITYIVDTIKPSHIAVAGETDNYWTIVDSGGYYKITSEQISRAIESNQLLRPWDNVPKKALAQEVSGNRIIYGNYTQGYDLKLIDGFDYYPDFDVTINGEDVTGKTQPSIKSLRDYQIGAVFIDEHGRETPVVSNQTGTTKLLKTDASKSNKLEVSFNDTHIPRDSDGNISLKYVKFFVKETSGEYYNMAMDRYYNAEDGQVWLSFPSSERNKVTEDDYLILKKGVNTNDLITEEAKYKVLDIKNEAPEFITRDYIKIEEIIQLASSSSRNIFSTNMVNAPIKGVNNFKVNYKPFSTGSSKNFQDIEDKLYIEFKDTASNRSSKIYEVSSVFHDYDGPTGNVDISSAKYTFRIGEDFDDDINFISNDISGEDPTQINDGVSLRIYKAKPTKNSEFDGRFFVKIDTDPTVNSKVVIPSKALVENPTYRTILSKEIHLMRSNHNTLHREELMYGENAIGMYGNPGGTSRGFGRMAPYFRDYRHSEGNTKWEDPSGTDTNVGQYKFSYWSSGWLRELGWITTNGTYIARSNDSALGTGTNGKVSGEDFPGGTSLSSADVKYGDDQSFSDAERNERSIWFIDKGPYIAKKNATQAEENYANNWSRLEYGANTGQGVFQAEDAIGSTDVGGFELSIGGVFSFENPLSIGDDKIENFYNIGDPQNPRYSEPETIDLVQKISSPGQKFRWEKDPTREVYTMQKMQKLQGRFRTHTVEDGSSGFVDNEWPFELNNTTGDPNISDYTDQSGDYRRNTYLLSPNYTSTFFPLWLNSDGGDTMPWDPTGSLGPIANGLELTITAATGQTAGDSYTNSDVFVKVESLLATNTDGTSRNIEVGMILTKHGSHDLNGGFNAANAPLLVWKIEKNSSTDYDIHLCGYSHPLADEDVTVGVALYKAHEIFNTSTDFTDSETLIFKQPTMNGYTRFSCNRINSQIRGVTFASGLGADTSVHDPVQGIYGIPRIMAVTYNLEFVEEVEGKVGLPKNPAIWETEPKENTPLDIYYEASSYNPLILNDDTKNIVIPIGSIIEHVENPASIPSGTTILDVVKNNTDWTLELSADVLVSGAYIKSGGNASNLKITRPDGSAIIFEATGWLNADANDRTHEIRILGDLYGPDSKYVLNWHNCYSFGNGVESNRIRDTFNAPFIANGVKASTTIPFPAEGEEHRKYGLIYSGIYNANSATNNLNQFIAAEKITKDINPIYGSIQKLHSRDTDLVTLCEDKVLKILANKDAVYNADGNPQLTANLNVLGQTIPFVGEYGISTNPESFASENYRAYFTDRVRGSVMRLSKDGLTAISEHGMKDWFRDNLSLGITNLLGENNFSSLSVWEPRSNNNIKVQDGIATFGYYNEDSSIMDDRWGRPGLLRMNNILEVGKTYRLQYDVISHSGLEMDNGSGRAGLAVNNNPDGGWQAVGQSSNSRIDGAHVNVTWTANTTDFYMIQMQVNSRHDFDIDGDGTIQSSEENLPGYYEHNGTVISIQNYAQTIDGNKTWSGNFLYGGILSIKNLILEEVKEDLTLIGSYDDKKEEYNLTIHGTNPITASFKESAKGWESFKSFIPENALSCANDYYTIKGGKLWQHHNEGVNKNTFYNQYHNSTINVLLNDAPSLVKSYHTLDYEGSQSRVEGIKTVTVTGIKHSLGSGYDGRYFFFEESDMNSLLNRSDWFATGAGSLNAEKAVKMKQYRNNVLIYSGLMMLWNTTEPNSLNSPSGGPTKGHGRRTKADGNIDGTGVGNFEVGDIITIEQQEKSVDVFNSQPIEGWYVSGIETDLEKGSLLEFVKKEGKWYNYVKGINSEINESTDFGSFDIQGLGVVSDINGNTVYIEGNVNSSLQLDDIIYFESPSEVLDVDIIDTSKNTSIHSGFTIDDINTVTWSNIGVTTSPNYVANVMDEDSIIANKKYKLTLEVSNYNGTGDLGVGTAGGVSINARLAQDGYYEEEFIANGDRLNLFARDTNNGTIKVTVRQIIIGNVLGFTRLESNNLLKLSTVTATNVESNAFNVADVTGLSIGDYIMFVKNQVVNTSGVTGYYANAKFENNSIAKAELFAVSSEITESSK